MTLLSYFIIDLFLQNVIFVMLYILKMEVKSFGKLNFYHTDR